MLAPRTRSTAAALAGVLVLTGCGVFGGQDGGGGGGAGGPRSIAEAFLADWSQARYPEAGARTTTPTAATEALNDMQDALRPETRTLTAGDLSGDCGSSAGCRLDFHVDLALQSLGQWTYASSLQIVRAPAAAEAAGPAWRVSWDPSVLHPKMTATTAFSRTRNLAPRAPILDREGRALVSEQPVYRVGVTAGRVPDSAIEDLAELTDVNVDGLLIRTNKAEEGQFVEAVVLRESDYTALRSEIEKIDGAIVQADTLTLAPSRQFARGVLGAVGNATKEALANAGPTAAEVDSVGLFGLQGRYQKQLAGRAGGRVELINSSTTSPLETLVEFGTVPGTALHTTLDLDVQAAAERALTLTDEASSLVAVDTATGDVLAVANGPVDKAGEDRALNGQYAPGSVFKIISALALLRGGLKTTDEIGCPSNVNVDGKRFENYDGLGDLGRVSFATNFAQSCNTAFIRRVSDLEFDVLTEAAEDFGIGGNWDLLLDSFSGDVPPARDRVELAADGIGQGRVLMSPLAMAVVAAAVASGTPRYPRLILDGPPPDAAPPAPPPTVPTSPAAEPTFGASPTATPAAISTAAPFTPAPDTRPALDPIPEAETLRDLMYLTVRSGTARILDIGPPVGAKTGTAEYGSETEPGKHAWIVGFMANVAFAVIVERGNTGATTAGPIARAFLNDIL